MTRRIEVRRSPIHGNGIFAARDLAAETRLIEYAGKRLSHAQADKRYAGNAETGHTFLFTLNDRYVIDGNQQGNAARWINHSCEPNCQAFLIEHPGRDRKLDRVVIETIRPLKAGEELAYNYAITLDERHTPRLKKLWECRCGSPSCTGTLLKTKSRPAKKS
ncbi:MAG: SET domain-containing protein-lysine N-methyltransferase [Pseudomonadota bacterium]